MDATKKLASLGGYNLLDVLRFGCIHEVTIPFCVWSSHARIFVMAAVAFFNHSYPGVSTAKLKLKLLFPCSRAIPHHLSN